MERTSLSRIAFSRMLVPNQLVVHEKGAPLGVGAGGMEEGCRMPIWGVIFGKAVPKDNRYEPVLCCLRNNVILGL
jgi:hypothetical protein